MHADELEMRQRLDPVERRLLELMATGLSIRDVAEQTGLPIDVVRIYLADVIGKLGARSKLEALIVAIRHGLIEIPRRQRPADGSGVASWRATDG
jgi:DNA-binding NarL/FixJ family response regulator